MNAPQMYIAVTILVLAAIALLRLVVNGKKQATPLTPLAGLAFGFVLAGTVFGADRRVGYALMGAGVVLAIIDMVRKSKGN